MNTPTIISSNAEWLRRGIAIVGAVLISGSIVLGLANRAAINSTPAAPAANLRPAQERYAAFKQRQAEQVADALMPLPPATLSAPERYLALQDQQAETRDATFVPANAYASPAIERYAALKQRQAEQVADTLMPLPPATLSAPERYLALKDQQAETRDASSR